MTRLAPKLRYALRRALHATGLDAYRHSTNRCQTRKQHRRSKQRRTRVNRWIRDSLDLLNKNNLHSFVISRKGAYVRLPSGAEFLYDLTVREDGGLLGLETIPGFEHRERAVLKSLFVPEGVFIDIGACYGLYSIELAVIYPSSVVYAFEPNTSAFKRLMHNIHHNDLSSQICAHRLAVSNRAGASYMTVEWAGSALLMDSISADVEKEKVTCVRLDTFVKENHIRRVDLVKCDVEGSEMLVMQGAENVLRHHRPVWCLEIAPSLLARAGSSPVDIFEYFERHNYRRLTITRNGWDPLADKGNIIFYPSEKPEPAWPSELQ